MMVNENKRRRPDSDDPPSTHPNNDMTPTRSNMNGGNNNPTNNGRQIDAFVFPDPPQATLQHSSPDLVGASEEEYKMYDDLMNLSDSGEDMLNIPSLHSYNSVLSGDSTLSKPAKPMRLRSLNPFTYSGQYFQRRKGRRVQNVVEVKGPHKHGETQYRITGRKTSDNQTEQLIDNEIEFANRLRFGLNAAICKFLKWNFKTNLFIVLIVAIAFFVIFTIIFGLLIVLSVTNHPDCISSSLEGTTLTERFWLGWSLSWTTFSTVGYGGISPSTPGSEFSEGNSFENSMSCAFVNIFCSMESFIGVLFASFWSAILFGKLDLFKSDAQVQFCDYMVVRYDEGGSMTVKKYDKDGKDIDYTFSRKLTCPIIAFRLVNLLDSHLAGEIIDARLSAVALIDGDQIDTTTRMLAGHAMFGKAFMSEKQHKKNIVTNFMHKTLSHTSRTSSGDSVSSSERSATTVPAASLKSNRWKHILSSHDQHSVRSMPILMPKTSRRKRSLQDADSHSLPTISSSISVGQKHSRRGSFSSTSSLTDVGLEKNVEIYTHLNEDQSNEIPKMVYAKLSITPDEHPFFQRVWRFVHVLDEYSPLLSQSVRNRIKKDGQWPSDLSNQKAIEDNLEFDQILVSFSGLANVTADEVFEQKIYEKKDLEIGFQFCSMLARDSNGALTVRLEDLNKIRKQDKL